MEGKGHASSNPSQTIQFLANQQTTERVREFSPSKNLKAADAPSSNDIELASNLRPDLKDMATEMLPEQMKNGRI